MTTWTVIVLLLQVVVSMSHTMEKSSNKYFIENGTELISIDENGTLITNSSSYPFFRTCKVAFSDTFTYLKSIWFLWKGFNYVRCIEALTLCINNHLKMYVDPFLSSLKPLGTVCHNILPIYNKHYIIHTLVPYIAVYKGGIFL